MLRRSILGLAIAAVAALVVAAAGVAAPTLTLPGTITVPADGPTGAEVTYSVSATNPNDKPLPVSCDGPGGGSATGTLTVTARFPIGTTTVNCIAGEGDDIASGSFDVVVTGGAQDTTPPVVTAPAPVQQEATGSNGATVTYGAATAVDDVDGPLAAQCSPASGSLFPLGTTTVTCTATDAAGNTGSASFAVVVSDSTPPALTAPAAVTVTTSGTSPVPATNAVIAAFLAGASATDAVDPAPLITNDAPSAFPVGTTTVRFAATDASGNRSEVTSTVTVTSPGSPPPPPPPPSPPASPPPPASPQPPASPPATPQPARPDTTPPGDVAGLRVTPGNRRASLAWTLPRDADLDGVAITRTAQASGAQRVVYRGRASRFVDTNLRNGAAYRYVLVTYDLAGNRSSGVAAIARPVAPKLIQPPDGARVTAPPRLAWARVANAAYYNVQVFRGTRKVLSVWPAANRFTLPRTWTFLGRRYSLQPGVYRWYVWPGFGARSGARYGTVLGQSSFVVAPR